MVEIALFLLIEPRFRLQEPAIRQYFETHHREAGGYRIQQDDVLLVVGKNGA